MEPEKYQKFYDWVVDLAKRNPAASTFVVFFLLLGATLSSLHTAVAGYLYVSEHFDLKSIVGGSLGLLAGLLVISFSIISMLRKFYKPRPEITNLQKTVLSADHCLHWKYNAPQNVIPTYVVQATKNGSSMKEYSTHSSDYFRVEDDGRYEFRVKALLRGGGNVISKKFEMEVYKDSISRIRNTGRVRVGFHVDRSRGVFCFNSKERPGLDGFDVDIAGLIVKGLESRLNLGKLEIDDSDYAWDEILEKTKDGEVDFTIASLSITSDRGKTVLFSAPYLKTSLAVVFDSSSQSNFLQKPNLQVSDLKGHRIGVHINTTTKAMRGSVLSTRQGNGRDLQG